MFSVQCLGVGVLQSPAIESGPLSAVHLQLHQVHHLQQLPAVLHLRKLREPRQQSHLYPCRHPYQPRQPTRATLNLDLVDVTTWSSHTGHPTRDCASKVTRHPATEPPPLLESHPLPRLTNLPGKWLQWQANGSNVCRVLRHTLLFTPYTLHTTPQTLSPEP